MEFASKFTRTDIERNWATFVRWIGYGDLVKALDRKQASLADAYNVKDIVPKLYSIELGLSQIVQRWRVSRSLAFPKAKSQYDAYSFVSSIIDIKRHLRSDQALAFRSRLVADILPAGRLANLDHEIRIAQNLHQFDWEILHFGFCGNPGPDFIARRGGIEIEVEGKCITPEIGLPVSFGFVGRVFGRVGKGLKSQHPGHFVQVRIELLRPDRSFDADRISRWAIESYETAKTIERDDVHITVEMENLDSFGRRFAGELKHDDAIDKIFSVVRTRYGDYGYFAQRDDELIFFNLVPLRENRQRKNVLKLISNTCDRQFSKNRPALLWLHLQALESSELQRSWLENPPFVERLARHAFRSNRRSHVASMLFSGDTAIEPKQHTIGNRSARGVESTGYVKGFDNPQCRFGEAPVFASLWGR